jgi:hypothetical protein
MLEFKAHLHFFEIHGLAGLGENIVLGWTEKCYKNINT